MIKIDFNSRINNEIVTEITVWYDRENRAWIVTPVDASGAPAYGSDVEYIGEGKVIALRTANRLANRFSVKVIRT